MLKLHIHANIWSDEVHVLCPPKLVKEVVNLLETLPDTELNLFPSAQEIDVWRSLVDR
jgi:hypothetical protein